MEPPHHAVWVLDVQAGIGPAIADWLIRSPEDAAAEDISLFVIRLDTPGALDKTNTIVFPLPIDMMEAFRSSNSGQRKT